MSTPNPSATKLKAEVERSPIADSPLATALAAHPFLRGLEPDQIKLLAANAMSIVIPAGELIFREGDVANRFYLIQEGEVMLESSDDLGGHAVRIETIGAGDVLGWSWMFPPYYWHFGARATQPTKAIFIYGTRLLEACEAGSKLGYALVKRVAELVIRRLQATRCRLALQTGGGH